MDNNEHGTNLASLGTDAISRRAAIDALKRAKQNIHHNIERAIGDAVCGILDEVENGIKQLPPANCSEIPNNSDTISRQAAIDAVQNRHMMLNKEKVLLINDLEKLPSAQPERARGTWMPDTMCYYEERFICSECKGNYKVDTCMGKPMWNFCPNCGADMRQKGENSEIN